MPYSVSNPRQRWWSCASQKQLKHFRMVSSSTSCSYPILEPVYGIKPNTDCAVARIWERGECIFADPNRHRLVVLDSKTGEISSVVGCGMDGAKDAFGNEIEFSGPSGLAVCTDQNKIFVSDSNVSMIIAK